MRQNNFVQKRIKNYLTYIGRKYFISFIPIIIHTKHIIAIMAKRSIEETYSEDSTSEFKYDNSEDKLRKKIKLEILDKVQEIEQEIDISEHEVHKFLLIFETLVQIINSNEPQEETDGLMTDVILQIVNTIIHLYKNNTDSLNIPAVLKSALKKLQTLFIAQTKDSEEGNPGDPGPENGQDTNESQGGSEASREGRKKQ